MKMFQTIAFALLLPIAGASAQQTPQPPAGTAVQPPAPPGQPLPLAPAEQFKPCTGIIDLEARADCIERQTEKGNPAVRSLDEGTDTKDGKGQKRD